MLLLGKFMKLNTLNINIKLHININKYNPKYKYINEVNLNYEFSNLNSELLKFSLIFHLHENYLSFHIHIQILQQKSYLF